MSPRGFKLPAPIRRVVKRSSEFLGMKSRSPSPLTTAVPTEIIEEILLHLPGQDILKMKQVRWDSGGWPFNRAAVDTPLMSGQPGLCLFGLHVPDLGVPAWTLCCRLGRKSSLLV